ncbi:MAG: cyclic nucleotide-binding domain-containing protein [Pseudomonadota bacterium]|nr:cyclic nucleotide-binding domain-containing protein [Pseudomonadota bacterium]
MNSYEPVHTADALTGLLAAMRMGQAYDALPCTLSSGQWACLASYLLPYPVNTGHVPIRQGERDRTLYFIESGALTVHRDNPYGRMKLAVLAPGTVVGEGAFFTGGPRNATVVATRDSKLWCLKHGRFTELAQRQPAIALALSMACAAVVVRRLDHTHLRVAVT